MTSACLSASCSVTATASASGTATSSATASGSGTGTGTGTGAGSGTGTAGPGPLNCSSVYEIPNPSNTECILDCPIGTFGNETTRECLCAENYFQPQGSSGVDSQGRRICEFCKPPYKFIDTARSTCEFACATGTVGNETTDICDCLPNYLSNSSDTLGRQQCYCDSEYRSIDVNFGTCNYTCAAESTNTFANLETGECTCQPFTVQVGVDLSQRRVCECLPSQQVACNAERPFLRYCDDTEIPTKAANCCMTCQPRECTFAQQQSCLAQVDTGQIENCAIGGIEQHTFNTSTCCVNCVRKKSGNASASCFAVDSTDLVDCVAAQPLCRPGEIPFHQPADFCCGSCRRIEASCSMLDYMFCRQGTRYCDSGEQPVPVIGSCCASCRPTPQPSCTECTDPDQICARLDGSSWASEGTCLKRNGLYQVQVTLTPATVSRQELLVRLDAQLAKPEMCTLLLDMVHESILRYCDVSAVLPSSSPRCDQARRELASIELLDNSACQVSADGSKATVDIGFVLSETFADFEISSLTATDNNIPMIADMYHQLTGTRMRGHAIRELTNRFQAETRTRNSASTKIGSSSQRSYAIASLLDFDADFVALIENAFAFDSTADSFTITGVAIEDPVTSPIWYVAASFLSFVMWFSVTSCGCYLAHRKKLIKSKEWVNAIPCVRWMKEDVVEEEEIENDRRKRLRHLKSRKFFIPYEDQMGVDRSRRRARNIGHNDEELELRDLAEADPSWQDAHQRMERIEHERSGLEQINEMYNRTGAIRRRVAANEEVLANMDDHDPNKVVSPITIFGMVAGICIPFVGLGTWCATRSKKEGSRDREVGNMAAWVGFANLAALFVWALFFRE
jgi:hypothetical protein